MYLENTAEILTQYLSLEKEQILQLLERPKYTNYGDVSFPCFTLAKELRKSPLIIAKELSERIQHPYFREVRNEGGYVNIYLQPGLIYNETILDVMSKQEKYGSSTVGEGKTVVIDFSSPNIAKPFSMGHLRSTVIGNSLGLLYEKNGYSTTKINYIGDWGTQFGKLMAAYEWWGNDEAIKEDPIRELLRLYVDFHEEAKEDPTLNDKGREWFKRLEDGDEKASKLWKWFRDLSLVEFNRIYDLLGVSFDYIQGESFYNDKMGKVVDELKEQKLLEESEGAHVVSLGDEMPPCLILKSDGATLYATRDLASVLYRKKEYKFDSAIYVVGQEQTLHFKQVKSVIKKMGYDWCEQFLHIPFGLILKDGKKMSTRKGKVVLLNEVLKEAISIARKNIEVKNPTLMNKEVTAEQVGVGAVLFHDLKHHRIHDFEFSLEDMLAFEGETGPYLQYTFARIQSLLEKGKFTFSKEVIPSDESDQLEVTKLIARFPLIVEKACEDHDPSLLARFLLDLAKEFNSYYHAVKIIDQSSFQTARLQFTYAVGVVLKEGLRLLGIGAPKRM
ncbi:arginine--tRNA ligase [Bacillus suaedaesalsae]|uniref:Arginine--tRNA ligase n=1 Tax=Bacillus suaedaesalsae TaxID=2810349 RepID=A0ABS2DLM6_9BACI|nr:arginine--tRNA ligase [Bacillus suaedaesalsae]MBM6619390.1 arginine--tRNA ligase [Bacillus suaedaesalsae]